MIHTNDTLNEANSALKSYKRPGAKTPAAKQPDTVATRRRIADLQKQLAALEGQLTKASATRLVRLINKFNCACNTPRPAWGSQEINPGDRWHRRANYGASSLHVVDAR
jgi:hypothetical protein